MVTHHLLASWARASSLEENLAVEVRTDALIGDGSSGCAHRWPSVPVAEIVVPGEAFAYAGSGFVYAAPTLWS
jgi:hypothetical protein